MAEETLSARLVEIESMLDHSRRRFDEGSRLVEEAHKLLGEIQQALIGSPRSAAESSMLDDAGRDRAQIGIRSQVWDPDTRVVDKGAATIQILNAPAADTNIASAQAGQ